MAIEIKIEKDSKNKCMTAVIKAIELGRRSKIPILFVANPGIGKSTSVQQYAKDNNLHAEMVIGASFLPEDLSGYQVYSSKEDCLKHMTPVWFHRIWDNANNGKQSILFLDELSTTDLVTQNASLHVIKERKLTNGNPLPDNTIIIGAANYKGNLDSAAHIQAVEINRFIVYNIGDYNYVSTDDIIDEFTQPEIPVVKVPFENRTIDAEYHIKIYKAVNQFLKDLFGKYAKTKNASSGYLDIFNKKYDDLYELDGNIYNIICGGRSMSNLCIATESMISMGIKSTDPFFSMTLLGLIGAGTCNFTPEQIVDYHKNAIELYKNMYDSLSLNKEFLASDVELDFTGKTITDAIKYWENYYESSNGKIDKNIISLHNYLGIQLKKYDWQNLTKVYEPELVSIKETLTRISTCLAESLVDIAGKDKERVMKCLSKFTIWIKQIDTVLEIIQ